MGVTQSNKRSHALAPEDKVSPPESTVSNADTAKNEVNDESFGDDVEYTKWSGRASHTVSSSDELIIIPGEEVNYRGVSRR